MANRPPDNELLHRREYHKHARVERESAVVHLLRGNRRCGFRLLRSLVVSALIASVVSGSDLGAAISWRWPLTAFACPWGCRCMLEWPCLPLQGITGPCWGCTARTLRVRPWCRQ